LRRGVCQGCLAFWVRGCTASIAGFFKGYSFGVCQRNAGYAVKLQFQRRYDEEVAKPP
jgi:hypothetical protein